MKTLKYKPLTSLLTRADIWQGSSLKSNNDSLDTGFSQLNQALHHGGWPKGGLTEILADRLGGAELSLLAPCLAQLNQQPGWLMLIAPPYTPYAPAWIQQGIEVNRVIIVQPQNHHDLLWSTEQALRSGLCRAVFSWLAAPGIDYKNLRKLQLASHGSPGLSILIRPSQCANQASPTKLRMKLSAQPPALQLHILKQPGGWAGQKIVLPLNDRLMRGQVPASQLPVHYPQANRTRPLKQHLVSIPAPPVTQSAPLTARGALNE